MAYVLTEWMIETAVVLNVSEAEIKRSGNTESLDTVVELDEDNGGGYMGTLELFHQLHCLNQLRRWTYWGYYSPIDPFFATRADHRREHVDHCIDVIRLALMCNADTNLILFHWIKDIEVPSPNFRTLVSDLSKYI